MASSSAREPRTPAQTGWGSATRTACFRTHRSLRPLSICSWCASTSRAATRTLGCGLTPRSIASLRPEVPMRVRTTSRSFPSTSFRCSSRARTTPVSMKSGSALHSPRYPPQQALQTRHRRSRAPETRVPRRTKRSVCRSPRLIRMDRRSSTRPPGCRRA